MSRNSEEDRASGFSLASESSASVAEEVQQLNPDVMEQLILEEDPMGGNTIARTLTKKSGDEENQQSRRPSLIQRRRSTVVESIKGTQAYQKIAKFGFWDTEFKRQRIKIYTSFLKNYLVLSVILIMVLSIMWGTYYHRERRYHNIRTIIVNDDLEVDGITPFIGDAINETSNLEQVVTYGGWDIFTHEEFAEQAAKHGNTYREELLRLVHHQEYWAAIYVYPNVTYNMYQAINANDTTFNVSEALIEVLYESGRDPITMTAYTTPFIKAFEQAFLKVVKQKYSAFVSELSSNESKLTSLSFLAQPITFLYTDSRPASAILMAPLQLGLTYIVVFTFFQMALTIRIQIYLSTIVHGLRYLVYRMIASQVAYMVIGASYVVLNVAFQIDVTSAFGKSGGLVMWAIAYLTMGSLGALNEAAAMLLFTYYPPLIGGWLVCLMATNVAPTTSPMALTNAFYRYGYAMPIHNSYELSKVVFCDTYKGNMGRNIGILVAWMVIGNILSPLAMIHVSKVKAKREKQAKEKAELEAAQLGTHAE